MARILIVDDEPDVRELFNITLKMAGHVTETAKHGLEAVDKLAADIPELIVLDLMMPHLDGFGLLNHIRNEMSTKPIRVLVATAKVLEESDQEKLGSWPVVGVLNKGELDIGQMVMIVTTALTQNPMKAGASVPAPAPATTSTSPTTGSSAPAGASPAPAPASPTPAPAASAPKATPSTPASPPPAQTPAPSAPTAPAAPASPASAPTPASSSPTPTTPTSPAPAPSTSTATTSTTKDGA